MIITIVYHPMLCKRLKVIQLHFMKPIYLVQIKWKLQQTFGHKSPNISSVLETYPSFPPPWGQSERLGKASWDLVWWFLLSYKGGGRGSGAQCLCTLGWLTLLLHSHWLNWSLLHTALSAAYPEASSWIGPTAGHSARIYSIPKGHWTVSQCKDYSQ